MCDNQIDRPIPLDSAIYAVINRNDLCTCGISTEHIFLYESMHTCTDPDTSVTLFYIENRALLAYDPSLHENERSMEQYQTTIPEYQVPDISYKKKSIDDISNSKRTRRCRNIPSNNDSEKNVAVDDLLLLSFPLLEPVDFMETGKTFYIPSTHQACKLPVGFSVPLLQDMDFYFNIVTVINFLTSVINALVITVCYRNHKNLLSGILMVVMEMLDNNKKVQALKLTDNKITTIDSLMTRVNLSTNNTHYFPYFTPWIFLIVLLSMLTSFALYWIFVLIVRPLTRKSSIC